jgi:hypothetical protein
MALALLAGSPVGAQQQTADAVMDGMAQLGIETEGLVLTEEQVLQVETILNGTGEESEKVSQINQLLGL